LFYLFSCLPQLTIYCFFLFITIVNFMRSNYIYGSLASYVDAGDAAASQEWRGGAEAAGPLEVEIGFGTGEYIVGLAQKAPEKLFIGFEQNPERVIKGLRKVHAAGLSNIRLMKLDAVWGLKFFFLPGSLAAVHCLFPLPWPRDKDEKHRLLTPSVLALIKSRLDKNGFFKLVTDQRPYADWVLGNAAGSGLRADVKAVPATYATKFERKWSAAGQKEFTEIIFTHGPWHEPCQEERPEVQVYFLDEIDPARVIFPRLTGDITVVFKDYMFDPLRSRGMVQAVVTEDRRTQYLWITVSRTSKGWCIAGAPGSAALPTEGVRQAMGLAYEAFRQSVITG
jgi:tRNA (guanine-N7-)-methyltransferase